MLTTNLITGQEAIIPLSATGADGTGKPAGISAKVVPYPGLHLSLSSGGSPLHAVADSAGDYTVTISGHSQDGTTLPNDLLQFHVTVPPPPQATSIVVGTITIKGADITTPADPGTDTVVGNL